MSIFFSADSDNGRRVAQGLGFDAKEVERLTAMTQEEWVQATEQGTYPPGTAALRAASYAKFLPDFFWTGGDLT